MDTLQKRLLRVSVVLEKLGGLSRSLYRPNVMAGQYFRVIKPTYAYANIAKEGSGERVVFKPGMNVEATGEHRQGLLEVFFKGRKWWVRSEALGHSLQAEFELSRNFG